MSERIRKGDGVRAVDYPACATEGGKYHPELRPLWAGLVGRVERVGPDATAIVQFFNPTDPRLMERIETVPLADLKLLAISQSIPQNMWTPALDTAYRMVRDAEAKAKEMR